MSLLLLLLLLLRRAPARNAHMDATAVGASTVAEVISANTNVGAINAENAMVKTFVSTIVGVIFARNAAVHQYVNTRAYVVSAKNAMAHQVASIIINAPDASIATERRFASTKNDENNALSAVEVVSVYMIVSAVPAKTVCRFLNALHVDDSVLYVPIFGFRHSVYEPRLNAVPNAIQRSRIEPKLLFVQCL